MARGLLPGTLVRTALPLSTFPHMSLLRKLFWVALTAVWTFGFVVLYENGTTNYADNAKRQFEELRAQMNTQPMKKKTNGSDPLK